MEVGLSNMNAMLKLHAQGTRRSRRGNPLASNRRTGCISFILAPRLGDWVIPEADWIGAERS
jgi:hypothetical protein